MKSFMVMAALFVMQTASATVEGEAHVYVPYMPAQAGFTYDYLVEEWGQEWAKPTMFCMAERIYFDHYSSSALPAYELLTMPYMVDSVPAHYGPVNLNILNNPKVRIETDWDKFDKYIEDTKLGKVVHEPEFVVDVSAFDKTLATERLESIMMAKVAIMGIHYNLSQYNFDFRASITVKGLPENQQEFTNPNFTRVYETTNSPYSKPSPVVQNYYKELLAKDFCANDVAEAKSFAP